MQEAAPLPPFFLRTKLLAPRPAPTLLPRPRLFERLERNLEHAVTLVTANAGSGKTTLVADFLRTHATPHVWYQLDVTDADPGTFFGYLTTGIRQIVPSFGETTLAYLAGAAGELAEHAERAVDVLLNELLDEVESRIVIVLDDYHHLGTSSPVHRAMDRLIAYMPDVLHVILVSREAPPLALARLRSRATVDVIGRDDLLFTDDETRELFRVVFGLEMTPGQLAEYRERTHGWITALQLVRQVVERGDAEDGQAVDLGRVLKRSERDIFDYFAEEVFAGETDEIRDLLMRVSLLERIETDACAALYPGSPVAATLEALVRRNVFVTVVGDGEEFRLHPLFQAFLRRRYRTEVGDERLAEEHRRAATIFDDRRQWELAVAHYVAAGDDADAAAAIARSGPEWIAAGKLSALASFAADLPPAALAAHPRALLAQAEVARLRGDYDGARPLYRRAAPLLDAAGDLEGEAEALHALATIARRRTDFADAFDLLDRASALAEPSSIVAAKCKNTRGLCLLQTGKLGDGERELREALDVAESLGDDHYVRVIAHNLGGPAMVRGDFDEAVRWLRRMLGDGTKGHPVPQEATGHLNIARCLLARGDLDACEHHLGLAIERCQQFSLEGLVGEIFECFGNLHRERAEYVRAAEAYARARRAYADAGIGAALREVLDEEAILRLETGDVAGARATAERLVADRRAAGDDVGALTATLTLGRVLVAQESCSEAIAVLEPARVFFRAHGFAFYEAQTSFELAACARAEGDRKTFLERIARVVDLATRFDYEYWLRREVARKQSLFADHAARDLLPVDVGESIPAEPLRVVTERIDVAAPAVPDLTIRLLGPVEIERDPARPIPPDAWPTRRARDILCFLASQPNRRASKDVLIDTFWGESEFEAVEKNFHPTISHVRKALNAGQLMKRNFIVYRDGDYILNPEFEVHIDVERLERLYVESETARREGDVRRRTALAEDALRLFRGEFMQGSYDEWVEQPRLSYSERRLSLLETLAHAAEAEADWARVLDITGTILRADAFREEIHCVAMRAHAASGNRGAVREQYESLKTLLADELGVEPAASTRRAYETLLGA